MDEDVRTVRRIQSGSIVHFCDAGGGGGDVCEGGSEVMAAQGGTEEDSGEDETEEGESERGAWREAPTRMWCCRKWTICMITRSADSSSDCINGERADIRGLA